MSYPKCYRVTLYLQAVIEGDQAIIWHSLFGHPKIVSTETLAFLRKLDCLQKLEKMLRDLDEESRAAVTDLIAVQLIMEEGVDERALLASAMRKREASITDGSRIDYLELIMSEVCNFRCTYCIHFNNLETSDRISTPQKFMKLETAKCAVDEFLEILRRHRKKIAEINFGGGEPLLAWSVIAEILGYCQQRYRSEFDFRFSINTNASLITPGIARTLKEYRVEVASSLDGLRAGNDRVRLTRGGNGTFSAIIRGFDTLAREGYPLGGIAVTVNERNFPELDQRIIEWAAERGMSEVRVDIDVIGMVEIPIVEIADRLMRIRRHGAARNIEVFGFWSRPAENLNESALNADVAFCGAVRGNSMCTSPSGRIYGCGYSTTELGNLLEIKSFHEPELLYHRFVRDRQTGSIEMCRGCMIEGQCGGGCNITQEFARATASVKIDRMCDFYRQMTRELLREELRTSGAEPATPEERR